MVRNWVVLIDSELTGSLAMLTCNTERTILHYNVILPEMICFMSDVFLKI